MSPDKLGCTPLKLLNNVDFPTPFTPISPTNSPFSISRLMAAAIQVSPDLFRYPILRLLVLTTLFEVEFLILKYKFSFSN